MGQVCYGSAATTHAIQAAIQRSHTSLATLSRELGINPKTVAKWRKRATVEENRPEGAALHDTIQIIIRVKVMQNIFLRGERAKKHNQATAAKYIRHAKQKEALIWADWIFTFGILVCLSAASLALNWPIPVICILILMTSIFGFLLVLLIMLAFDKDAFK